MNLQTVRGAITNWLLGRIRIDAFNLEYPPTLDSPIATETLPANSCITLPIQNVVHYKFGTGTVRTKARFPYRIAYRYSNVLGYHELPMTLLEGVLSFIQILTVLESPDGDISSFESVQLEDSITVSRSEEVDRDWLVYLNIAFDAEFNTTTFPNLTGINPTNFYQIDNPPDFNELKIRVYRAKQGFNTSNPASHTLDTELTIT
ncbi:hypothetical protein H6G93_09260 [Nostoc sp. FACHB-973]|nr:hypothetical protein [Nostoc sp. FACHB-973]